MSDYITIPPNLAIKIEEIRRRTGCRDAAEVLRMAMSSWELLTSEEARTPGQAIRLPLFGSQVRPPKGELTLVVQGVDEYAEPEEAV